MKGTFSGVIIAPYLPFDEDGRIKEDILTKYINDIIKAGTDALYCLGTVEEFVSMTIEQRKDVAELLIEKVAKQIPVAIHVGTNRLAATIELARHSEQIGADAVYCVPPYYYTLDDNALVEYFKRIAASINIPLHIYDIPQTTKVHFSPELMSRLAEVPGITAVKDCECDLILTQQFKKMTDLDILYGVEPLFLPALVIGAVGCVSGGVGPVFPELVVEFFAAFRNRNFEKAREFQLKINAIADAIESTSSNWIQAHKEAIKLVKGYEMGITLPPLDQPLTAKEKEILISNLKNFNVI